MTRLSLCPKGFYKIIDIYSEQMQDRLLEIGFLPGIRLYILHNNSLGIQVRINRATYILNRVVASMIYVEKMEE